MSDRDSTPSLSGNAQAYWLLLLIPVLYASMDLVGGALGFLLRMPGMHVMEQFGYVTIRVLPVLPPILILVVSAFRNRMPRALFIVFAAAMILVWLANLIALAMFLEWGYTFHHGDLVE